MTTTLAYDDLMGPDGQAASPPGILAAALEPLLLDKMAAVLLGDQARLIDPRSATAYLADAQSEIAARVVRTLSLALARLARVYGEDFNYLDARNSTDAPCGRVERHARVVVARAQLENPGRDSYAGAREFEARLARVLAEVEAEQPPEDDDDIGTSAPASRPAAEQFSEKQFGKNQKTEHQFGTEDQIDGELPSGLETKSWNPGLEYGPPVNLALRVIDPAPARRRGAPAGNRNALKTGRYTVAARADRAQRRRMIASMNRLADAVKLLVGRAPAALAPQPASGPSSGAKT